MTTLKDAYEMAGVDNIRDLHRVYGEEDQRLMKSGKWDYDNPKLLTNRIRQVIEDLDIQALSREESEWCQEILWFWHHHAISCAIWQKKDRNAAKLHSWIALAYQGSDHPNKITRLLHLLVNDRFDEAVKWAESITEEPEKGTAISLLEEYKRGEFF